MIAHPHLAELHKLYQSETQSFRKVHRMIDLFESIIKTHTAVIISEYVQHNNLSDTAKGLLSQGLRTPSLGTWQLFSRVLIQELEKDSISWKLPSFVGEFHDLDSALNKEKTNVIAFRNGYAHGATPTDEQCELDICKFDPFLTKLLNFQWLLDSRTIVEDDKVYLSSSDQLLSLHPILLYRDEKEAPSIAFFNDIKNDKVGLLNYPLGKHYREKNFLSEFHQYIPIDEWKKTGNNEFEQRVEQLTETFKGRTSERANLLEFVSTQTKGYLSIQGNPGIGKSALIAQFFKDLKGEKNLQNVLIVEYFIRRGTPQAQSEFLINYLNKRTDDVFPPGKEIRAEGKMIFELQNQLFSKWRLWDQHANGRKLLFLIDGLDEGVENDILTYLPREVFENILFIYGSRPGGHKSIDDLWASLPVENHTKLELSSLGKDDIRAMIYDVANKYELERESPWIDAVQKRSQGNPLYLKLLCNSIENGSIAINDLNALPKEINEYYKAILSRYAQDMVDGDALLAGLFTFTAAKDYLTMTHLGLINQLGEATIQRIGSSLKEVLYENPLTDEVLDYQLFHESFREYLVKEKAKQVNDSAERILDFCADWEALEGTWEQRYTLEFYASHLNESKKESRKKELRGLIENSKYVETQKKVLKQYNSSRDLARIGLLKASELQQFDLLLECALQLVDLKYEEANDANQVVALVAAGEIDLALKRIESFGGSDQDGVKRRFILYMLCLIELTMLESKNKPIRKLGISKILQHLDEHIPDDHSILNWNHFFPSYLMFRMAVEWAELGLNFLSVYRRTANWDSSWISEHGPYTKFQLNVLLECATSINYDYSRGKAYSEISTEYAKHTFLEEANFVTEELFKIAQASRNEYHKSCLLERIAVSHAKQGHFHDAIQSAENISNEYFKCRTLGKISTELYKSGDLVKTSDVIKKTLLIAQSISDNANLFPSLFGDTDLMTIIDEHYVNGLQDETETIFKSFFSDALKIELITKISTILWKQNLWTEAKKLMDDAITNMQSKSDVNEKDNALGSISIELANQGRVNEAINFVHGIKDNNNRANKIVAICQSLVKLRKFADATLLWQEVIDIIDTAEIIGRDSLIAGISKGLVEHGDFDEALNCAARIIDNSDKYIAFLNIADEYIKRGNLIKCQSIALSAICRNKGETIESDYGINSNYWKNVELGFMSGVIAKQGAAEIAVHTANYIGDVRMRIDAIIEIADELRKKGNIESSFFLLRESYEKLKSQIAETLEGQKSWKIPSALNSLSLISWGYRKTGHIKESDDMLEEAISIANDIDDGLPWKIDSYYAISMALVKQNEIKKSLEIIDWGNHKRQKCELLISISRELTNIGEFDTAVVFLNDAICLSKSLSHDPNYGEILVAISSQLTHHGQIERTINVLKDALAAARANPKNIDKFKVFGEIYVEYAKMGRIDLAESVFTEAKAVASKIEDLTDRDIGLEELSKSFAQLLEIESSELIGSEIENSFRRHKNWREIAIIILEKHSWKIAVNSLGKLRNDEVRRFYSKGLILGVQDTLSEKFRLSFGIQAQDVTSQILIEGLILLVNDTDCIEALLQKYALRETLLGKPAYSLQERLNATLDIQWAIDIATQFPKVDTHARLSTNLEAWLHEIMDEDDRDQIELWAKQVAKGKISETDFLDKLETLNLP